MKKTNLIISCIALGLTSAVSAAPMPNSIVVQDKAVVPVLKTEVIRRVAGQEPVRNVTATVLEVTNQGKDIVAREIELQDGQENFSEQQLSTPVLKKGGVIVPTSKIEVSKTVKQGNEVIAKTKSIDAAGMEFKKGEAPIKRTLQLDQLENPKGTAKLSHAVQKENGAVTRDIMVISENDEALPTE